MFLQVVGSDPHGFDRDGIECWPAYRYRKRRICYSENGKLLLNIELLL
jgi:hypothetical protein